MAVGAPAVALRAGGGATRWWDGLRRRRALSADASVRWRRGLAGAGGSTWQRGPRGADVSAREARRWPGRGTRRAGGSVWDEEHA